MKSKHFSRWAVAFVILLAAAAAAAAAVVLSHQGGKDTTRFHQKAELLQDFVLADWVELEVGVNPAGNAGQVVFLSVCDGNERASVYSGTGGTLAAAWDAAVARAEKALRKSGLDPRWVKADVLYVSETVTLDELESRLAAAQPGFFRYGAAFDQDFQAALLEVELNSARICDAADGGIDREALEGYLKKAGRGSLSALPQECILFQCVGWLCDEESQVYALSASGLDQGRRPVERLDGDYAESLLSNASAFLEDQICEDGSFVYGLYPSEGEEIGSYTIACHVSAIWPLLCRYRLAPDEELAEKIDRAVQYMLERVIYDSQGRAYLYEEESEEIELGSCGAAVAALTGYMDVFQSEVYKEVCLALGEGILAMLDQDKGTYQHVWDRDFTCKEESRAVAYDGEATFALCRLYGLTGDPVWLDAAQSAVEHFIEADYTQYADHWVAYSMNEITKYVTDRPDYYAFALKNAQENLQAILADDTTCPAHLELLLATFELYDRLVQSGGSAAGFDLWPFLGAIYSRAEGQLNGYFYPEYAMYMENPQRVLDTFMARQDRFRVCIDDVQSNIGGYHLYRVNYDKLVQYGMLICAEIF